MILGNKNNKNTNLSINGRTGYLEIGLFGYKISIFSMIGNRYNGVKQCQFQVFHPEF